MIIENRKKFIVNVCYYALIIGLIYLGVKYLLPFLVPFLLGFGIAYILRKPISFCSNKLHISRKIGAIIFVSLFYIIILLLLTCIGLGGVYGVQSFITELPTLYTKYAEEIIVHLTEKIEEVIISVNNNQELLNMIEKGSDQLISSVGSVIKTISVALFGGVTNLATSLPGFFIKIVLMIISSFFAAIDYNKIMEFFSKQIGEKTSNLITEIKDYLFGTVFVCIKSYAIIMSITFVELSIGLTIIGVKNSIIIALLIAIFDILPVLGTGGVMIPWAVIEFILGDIKMGILLALVYLAITVIRNIIEPKIVGKELGLHPLVTLVSMFIGVNIAGIVGLFGFPIILSLLVHLNNKGVINIIKF